MIPLVAPFVTDHDRRDFKNAVDLGLLEHGLYEVQRFEEQFADFAGCAGAVAVNSGTNALAVVLTALDLVATHIPSFTCRALMDAANLAHCKPILVDNRCDIEHADFGAIIPADCRGVVSHMFGTRSMLDLGCEPVHDITLSLGAVQSPDVAVCSFNRDKMISTGRGGMIVAQDRAFLSRCRELAYYDRPSSDAYKPAFSFGMTGMQAALGRSQLAQLPSFIARRKEIAARYTEAFVSAGIECPTNADSVFFRYIIGVDDPTGKVARLAECGVEAGRGVNPPLHRLLGLSPAHFPGAETCFARLLSVPCHPSLTDEQVELITGLVIDVCEPSR